MNKSKEENNMPKYSITLRREMAEIAISVTEFDSGKIIYKSGFFGSTDYKYDEKFTELSQMFIKYAHDSVINADSCILLVPDASLGLINPDM